MSRRQCSKAGCLPSKAPKTIGQGFLIGSDLAKTLAVRVGDLVQLTTPTAIVTPAGVMTRARTVRVAGIFALGLYEFDSAYGFVSLTLAKRLLAKEVPEVMQVRVNDIYAASSIARTITEKLGDKYTAEDWSTWNRSLFSALLLEEDGDLHHDRAHRDGWGAQHHLVADPAGAAEEP
jgi:lipoprotein-releasing system permease protein